MTGPFSFCTTLRSGESAGLSAGVCSFAGGDALERPLSNTPAEAARATLPKSRRVSFSRSSLGGATGLQVLHPVVGHPPHAELVVLLSMLRDLSILMVPFTQAD